MTTPLFPLGAVVATLAALSLLGELEVSPSSLLERHASGDWGEVDGHDRRENEYGLDHGLRLVSSYPVGEDSRQVWIITEADRSSTCVLLPNEY